MDIDINFTKFNNTISISKTYFFNAQLSNLNNKISKH